MKKVIVKSKSKFPFKKAGKVAVKKVIKKVAKK
jgi:hypothetical protein